MAKTKRRKKFYFSIVSTVLLFVGVGLLVVVVHLRATIPAPEESAELVAKRLDRENNAYYALMEAVKLLPEEPGALMLKDEDGWECEYEPEPDSIGKILHVGRPDDDALLLDYVVKSKPATDLGLKALKKPWFLHPPEPEAGPVTNAEEPLALFFLHQRMLKDRQAMQKLVRLLQVRALIEPCSDEKETDGCLRLIESLRLMGLINQDGFRINPINPRVVVEIIKKTRPEHQRRMACGLGEMRRAYPPGRHFDTVIRDIYGLSVSTSSAALGDNVAWAMISGLLLRQKVFLHRHEALLRQAAEMTYKEYEELKARQPVLEKAEDVLSWHMVVPSFPRDNSYFLATADGVSIALALELFKQDTETYPNSLDALVPEYLPALPENPYAGGPFTYWREENDYVLSCIQNGAYPYQDGKELVFHAP
jgi:hypothetical protein